MLVDATDFFLRDATEIATSIKVAKLGDFKPDKERSTFYLPRTKAFPRNTEIEVLLTLGGENVSDKLKPLLPDGRTISVRQHHSFVALPEDGFRPRKLDPRVGFGRLSFKDYGANFNETTETQWIRRWRLEKKNPNEPVSEPVQPIVYYLDRGIPEPIRSAMREGALWWNVAFEKAGFKNAVQVRDLPENADPMDVRYSVIQWVHRVERGWSIGSHYDDPRTGEIICGKARMDSHRVRTMHNYWAAMVQPVEDDNCELGLDPLAELAFTLGTIEDEESLMLQRQAVLTAHEVGHTIGLQHNMGSSSAYPVDSLRSPSFTSSHGVAPSIMDYARFNYIAQPGDGVTNFYPMVGTYDIWAIKWGYTYFDGESTKSEQKILNEWIKSHSGDYEYWFGYSNGIDPRSQTESIGDDNMMASFYGIQNLKRILPKLLEWSYEEGKNYDDLKELYLNVNSQLRRYIGHVSTNVGGIFEDLKSNEEKGPVYVYVPKPQQKAAINFLNSYIFGSLDWLVDNNILDKIENIGSVERIRSLQVYTLNRLFNYNRLARMIENEQINKSLSYTVSEMIDDLNKTIWKDLYSSQSINLYNRNLQKGYVNILINLMNENQTQLSYYRRYGSNVKFDESDIRPIVLAELINLEKKTKSGIKQAKDSNTKNHLIYLNHLIKETTSKSI